MGIDWFKIIMVAIIVIQEFQILNLRRELDELQELMLLALSGKVKDIITYITNEDDDETSGDE